VDNNAVIWGIAGVAAGGVIVRPLRIPEYVWSSLGAAVLVAFGKALDFCVVYTPSSYLHG